MPHADSIVLTLIVEMLGSHENLAEMDGGIRDLLGPRQTGCGLGERGVASISDGVNPRLETTTVQR